IRDVCCNDDRLKSQSRRSARLARSRRVVHCARRDQSEVGRGEQIMLRNDVITNSLVAAGSLAFVGGSASASIISLGGTAGLTGNISSGAVTNGNTYAQRFDSTSGNNGVT